ncbi:prevent-host-death family protein [Calidithermus terrae]|uniref:Antitoxin n=1 Tax=Calidithermus terrae TaxID=1408545 RepID=A0A399EDC0_9DEIN|nr:type II toxin-antitoxin system Phd/YefM family antitoxin [Calidithermus terrae]RIH80960.1 prevent-host-death family protein [Calidithermus terrae]
MPKTGQLQEAKNKLSQVVNEALEDGPRIITRHGAAAALLSVNDCREIAPKTRNLYELFRDSPLVGVDLDLTRDEDDFGRPPLDFSERQSG